MADLSQPRAFTVLAAVVQQHMPVEDRFICGAFTIEPVIMLHTGQITRPALLTCSRFAGHSEDHLDLRCCYRPHRFPHDANVRVPRWEEREDWRICTCGKVYALCPTAAILRAVGLVPPVTNVVPRVG